MKVTGLQINITEGTTSSVVERFERPKGQHRVGEPYITDQARGGTIYWFGGAFYLLPARCTKKTARQNYFLGKIDDFGLMSNHVNIVGIHSGAPIVIPSQK